MFRQKVSYLRHELPAETVRSGDHNLTCDLGANIAIDMAQDGFVKGTGSQWPIRQAETEAILAGYGLISKTAPA